MYTVIAHFKFADYETWKKVFESAEGLRSSNGLKNTRVLRSADDPNEVFVESEVDDLPHARQFMSSPELRSGMERAGVVGRPEVYFLQD